MKNLNMFNLDSQTICFFRVWCFVLYPAAEIEKVCKGLELKRIERMVLNINLN